MIWIILALVTAPITLPVTARLALGKDEVEVFVAVALLGTILAVFGATLTEGVL